ncbi:unnamed protein product, partial [Diplocarpon coronariae]
MDGAQRTTSSLV